MRAALAGSGLALLLACVAWWALASGDEPLGAPDARGREVQGDAAGLAATASDADPAVRDARAPSSAGVAGTPLAALDAPGGRAASRAAGASGRGARPPARDGAIRGRLDLPAEVLAQRGSLELLVTRREESVLGRSSETWSVPARLDAQGRYVLRDLAPGAYRVQALLGGRAVSEPRRVALGSGGQVEDADFHGRREPSVRGVVLSLTGAPVVGARLEVDDAPGELSDAAGRFVLSDLEPGQHVVLVLHPEFAPERVPVTVPANGAPAEVEARLGPGAEARVTVLDRAGAPCPRVYVTFSAEDHLLGAHTDAEGVALVRGLEPGARYHVRFPGNEASVPTWYVVDESEPAHALTLTWSR